jgi:hypothetical protein
MRVLLSGIAVAIVLGVIAAAVLSTVQEPVYDVYSSSSTRLDQPGSNLVGRRWTGNPRETGSASGSAGETTGTARTAY